MTKHITEWLAEENGGSVWQRKRLDAVLVEQGFFDTRSKAQAGYHGWADFGSMDLKSR